MSDANPLDMVGQDESENVLVDLDEGHSGGHEDSEGIWLISYADLMTLLMGFFALMTSMASFDEQKFADVGDATAQYFNGEVEEPYKKLAEKIDKVIKERGLEDQVETQVKKTGIKLIFKGTLFFESGSIALRDNATSLMKEIVDILDENAGEKRFLIEGHTDDVPIKKGVIASNWELSALRAGAVARLFEDKGFDRNQIMTIGFGETRPKVPHRTEAGEPIFENQGQNRRVVLQVLNQHPL
ncbi:MAG: flagellar motor protein MotB [Pseudomonadota bacterium]